MWAEFSAQRVGRHIGGHAMARPGADRNTRGEQCVCMCASVCARACGHQKRPKAA